MTEVQTLKSPAVSKFLKLQEELQAQRQEPQWLIERRSAASARLQELGFPSSRDESWKYTKVAPIIDAVWALPTKADDVDLDDLQRFTGWEENAFRIVFVDGCYAPKLSALGDLPQGLILAAQSELLHTNPDLVEELEGRHVEHVADGFKALNAAFSTDGAIVRVPKSMNLERPIHLLFVATGTKPTMNSPRNVIDVGDQANATIVERYVGLTEGSYFTNAQTEIFVGQNAEVEHDKIQRESNKAFHLANLDVHIDRDGRFRSTAICVGAKIGRHEVRQEQGGSNTDCVLNGLYIVDGDRVSDNVVVANHSRNQGRSEQLYKGIIDDNGLGIFNGIIMAEENTLGTDAHQTNKNLLLSDTAVAETRPQLEIYADDIACSHGATVGQLDGDSLFYLLSRGIKEDQARGMLTQAFAMDVIERVGIKETRDRIESFLAERVSWARSREAEA